MVKRMVEGEEHYSTALAISAHHLKQSPSLGDVPFLIAALYFAQKTNVNPTRVQQRIDSC
jgi:hypothetical protein